MTEHSDTDIIEEVRFRTAQEFLAALSPQHADWQPNPLLWIYRGHANNAWKLLAKAHRAEEHPYEPFGVEWRIDEEQQEWSGYARAEKELLQRFSRALDRAGLPIPTRSLRVDSPGMEMISSADTHPDAVPLLALAQHFGLPTKLLDWTRQARFAAYFAAAGAAKTAADDAYLAVWALRLDFVDSVRERSVNQAELSTQTAPAASNPNLHAQQGLFTRIGGENAHCLPVDEFVRRAAVAATTWKLQPWDNVEGRNPNLVARPLMRRLVVPQKEAPALLRLLAHEGVSGATMFPGYNGVVRGLKEEALWDKPPVRPRHD